MQLDLELYREDVLVEQGVRISYVDVAPERPSQILVLVHGFGGRARQWRYQIEQFARNNRVIAIDLRGHGRSTRTTSGYVMERILNDVAAVLEHAKVEGRVVLIGHSFGVGIATDFTARFPSKVSHLILIAGAGEYDIAWFYRAAFHLPESLLRMIQPFTKGLLDASIPSLKRLYLDNMRQWSGWSTFPSLSPPTMVIMGNRDRVLPREAFERVAELVPEGSEVINVGVSAHMVMLERRDAVNRAIERFIETDQLTTHHSRWRSNAGKASDH
jgi:long-chain acyl-CoA synthetase